MIKNVCLFMSPSENSLQYPENLTRLTINLGVGVICGYLEEKGYNVTIKDLNLSLSQNFQDEYNHKQLEMVFDIDVFKNYILTGEDEEMDRLISRLLENMDLSEYDFFGVSIGGDFSFVQMQLGFILAKYLNKKYNKAVEIGGNNVSFLYIFKSVFQEMWEIVLSKFKFIVNGPGEKVIEAIIKGLDENKDEDWFNQLPGMVRLVDGEIISNKTEKPIVIKPDWGDLDMSCYTRCMIDEQGTEQKKQKAIRENLIYNYKWPDAYLDSPGLIVSKYNRMKREDVTEKLILPYIFNYNCPYSCAFCTQSDYERGSIVGGNPEQVIKDIKELIAKYNTNYFYFLNNAFNFSGKFADEFCNKVIDENLEIYWSDCGRFNNLTYERLELMKKAGCTKLTFGFESGSQKIINLIDKQIDLDHAEQVLKWCYDLKIWSDIEVIIGLPQEFDEDFKDTCDFITRNKKYINYFWVNEYFVVPNSLIGRFPERYGVELIEDNTNYRDLLIYNLKMYRNEHTDVQTSNSKLYGFNEINGRSFEEIVKQNSIKLKIINGMQNPEGDSAAKLFKMLCAVK